MGGYDGGGIGPNMPDMPNMPNLPDLPPGLFPGMGNSSSPTGKPHLSTMQLEMKAQEVPDSKTLEEWRQRWNSKFPPSQQFTEAKFQQFVGGLFKFLQYLIKQEKTEATQASQDLKKSETGDD